jgi:hypothetical protein
MMIREFVKKYSEKNKTTMKYDKFFFPEAANHKKKL